MAIVTITEAAKLSGKSTQTLYRHIKAGKLSKHSSGGIDTAELIRCYGELSQPAPVQDAVTSHAVRVQNDSDVISILQNEIDYLKKEALEREQQAIEREKRLMALLEHQAGKPAAGSGFFGGLFGSKR